MKSIAISFLCIGNGHFIQVQNFYNYIKDHYKLKLLSVVKPYNVDDQTILNKLKSSNILETNPIVYIHNTKYTNESNFQDVSVIFREMVHCKFKSGYKNFFEEQVTKLELKCLFSFFSFDNLEYSIPTMSIARQWITLQPLSRQLKTHISLTYPKNTYFYPIIVNDLEKTFIKTEQMLKFQIHGWFPPLISNIHLERNVTPNTCLIYFSLKEHLNLLPIISKNNPTFILNVFTKFEYNTNNKNIIIHPISNLFKEYQKTCACLISSSGNETIQEAVYNKIPIAIIKPENHYEQTINYITYVKYGMAKPFSENINLYELSHSTFKDYSTYENYIINAKSKILDEIQKII